MSVALNVPQLEDNQITRIEEGEVEAVEDLPQL